MSTFAKTTFNAAVYSASRPTYPNQLFDYIFRYHLSGHENPKPEAWNRAVDLGCGTGQATSRLGRFRHVTAIDPSKGMLEKAEAHLRNPHTWSWDSTRLNDETRKNASGNSGDFPELLLREGSAENLGGIVEEDSVDLLIAAQSCHWFDWPKVWRETQRVLRPNGIGTAAFWVYTEFRFTDFPGLNRLITDYSQGTDPNSKTSVGAHFQRPGRTVLERYLVDVPEPRDVLTEPMEKRGLGQVKRVYFCGEDRPDFFTENATVEPIIMRKEMKWRELLAYLRTWSALHTYHTRFPDDLKAPRDTRFWSEDSQDCKPPHDDIDGGDISIRFWKDLRSEAKKIYPSAKIGADDPVHIEWPLALLLVKKQ